MQMRRGVDYLPPLHRAILGYDYLVSTIHVNNDNRNSDVENRFN